MIGLINADMFGTPSEPGEHVDWSTPDVLTEREFVEDLGGTPAEVAAAMPWMIIFEHYEAEASDARRALRG